ncbi:protein kinase domain-containing protein [Singulisphaera sp. PoT]|uniref:protein kinase domain-containing protein n=1 Tax=Singulisphaera sp. PoT TaxID=3411797 RepID=UPI003BF488EB
MRVYDEFLASVRAGESPDPEEWYARHPRIADKLRLCLEVLDIAEHLDGTPGGADDPQQVTPTRLGDFLILRQLGRGGMGVVYEAEQISLNRRVALKALPIVSALDPKNLKRFKTEAEAAARLKHQNIVPIHTVGSERGIHFFTMQLVEGPTLAQWIKERREERDEAKKSGRPSPSPDERSEFFRLVATMGLHAAEALAHSHSQGILHRDIKPANLLLDQNRNLWVSDFGLARLKDGGDLTRTQEMPGTMRYMSPERVLGQDSSNELGDVYSLGVTLYELLLLRHMFDAQERGDLTRRIIHEEPTALRRVDPDIPPDLAKIVHKAMAKEMEDRYQSATELAIDLRCFLEGLPIHGRGPSLAKRATRWESRNRRTLMWAGPLAILVASLLTFPLIGLWRSRHVGLRERIIKYEANIKRAAQYLKRFEVTQAKELLSPYKEAKGPDDLRNFPWYYLWERCNPRTLVREIPANEGIIYRVRYFSDGKRLVSCGAGGTCRIWDLDTGTRLHSIEAHQGDANDLSLSADEKTLVTVGDDRVIKVWNVADAELKAELFEPKDRGPRDPNGPGDRRSFVSVSYLPDGKHLITGRNNGLIQVWNLETGKVESEFQDGDRNIAGLAVSPDGRYVVVASPSSAGAVLEIASQQPVLRLVATPKGGKAPPLVPGPPGINAEHPQAFQSSSFSHDGKILATAHLNGVIRLWDVEQGTCKVELPGHAEEALSVSFSPDDKRLASVGSDGTIRVWDLGQSVQLVDFQSEYWKAWSIAFSPDGNQLATGNIQGRIQVWDLTKPSDRVVLDKPTMVSLLLGFSAQGDVVTLNRDDGTLAFWSRESGKLLKTHMLPAPGPSVAPLLTPDGRYLAVLDSSRVLCAWDLKDDPPRMVHRLSQEEKGITGALTTIAAPPDLRWIALAQPLEGFYLWDPRADRLRKSPNARPGLTATNRDGKFVFFHEFGRVARWDLATDTIQRTDDTGHRPTPAAVNALALSPDGLTAATGGYDKIIKIWNMETLQPAVEDLVGHEGNVTALAFSPDNLILASGSSDNKIKIWSVTTGQELMTLEGHTNLVCTLKFSEDGSALSSRSINPKDRPEEVFLWLAPHLADRAEQLPAKQPGDR